MQNILYNNNDLSENDTNILRNIELSVIYNDYNKEDDFIYIGSIDDNGIYNKYVIKKLENNNTKLMKQGKIRLTKHIFDDSSSPNYTYCTHKQIIKVCNKQNTSIYMLRNGSFGWITGIIIKKIYIDLLEKMEITFGNKCVCTIDLKLMAKLFGHSLNNINDELVIIPLSRKLFVSKSVEQKELWNIPLDIKHFYGIPFLLLQFHEVRVNIHTRATDAIKYYVVFNYVKNYYGKKYKQPTSMGLLSFEKMNKNISEINRMVEEKKNECHIAKICINCFKSAILNNKNMTVYQALYMHSLCEVFPKDICKLIVNYVPYCANFEVIIYDELNNVETIFFRCYNNDFTIKDGMMDYTSSRLLNNIVIGHGAITNNIPVNNIAIGYNATTNNVSANNVITNENSQNNFCCML
jgi:hypothetical protein